VIEFSEKDGSLSFQVRVVPRASRSEIVGEHNGVLRVRIAAPPVDGAANEELIRTLARTFKVSRSAVEITAGHTSKIKHVTVRGVGPEVLKATSKPEH
jgi:uncharacterized protein (TIGR00251 family)